MESDEGDDGIPKDNKLCVSKLPIFHTPRLNLPSVSEDLDASFLEEQKYDHLKVLYDRKCKEMDDLKEFEKVEKYIQEDEKAKFLAIQEENRRLKMEIEENGNMRSAMAKVTEDMREKEIECNKVQKEKEALESHMAGVEMEKEKLQERYRIREQDLLGIINSAGPNMISPDALEQLKIDNEKLKMKLEEYKFEMQTEVSQRDKMIMELRDEINQSEKSKHDRESHLLHEIQTLRQKTETSDKISTMQHEISSMRDTILILEKTISDLEEEKKELSLMITDSSCMRNNTLKADDTLMDMTQSQGYNYDNETLEEIDQTILCELMCNGKRDSLTSKEKSLIESLEIVQQEKINLVDENEKLSNQVMEYVQETDDLRKKYDMMLSEKSNQVMQLKESLKKVQEDDKIFKDDYEDCVATICVLQREKDALIDQAALHDDELVQQKYDYEHKISFYFDKSTRYEQQISELNATIGDLTKKIFELEERFTISQADLCTRNEQAAEFDKISEKYATLMHDNSENRTKIAELQQQNESLETRKNTLMTEVKSLREKQIANEAFKVEREKYVNDLQQEVSELRKKATNLGEQAAKSQIEDNSAVDLKRQMALMKNSYDTALGNQKKEMDNMITQLKDVTASDEILKRDVEEKISFYRDKLSHCQEQMEIGRNQIEILSAENARMNASLAESHDNIKIIWELREQISLQRDQQTEQNLEKLKLKNSLEDATKQCVQLQNEKTSITEQLERYRRESDTILGPLEVNLRERDAQIVQLKENLMLCESEVQKHSKRVLELEVEHRETMKSFEHIQSKHQCQVEALQGIITTEMEEKQKLTVEKNKLDSINQELTNVTKDLRSVLEELKIDLDKSELELQASRESNKILQKELDDARENIQQMTEFNRQLQRESDDLREKHQGEIQAIKTEKTTQNEQLRHLLSSKIDAFKELSDEYRDMEQKYKIMESAKESNLIEVEALRQNVMHMESLIAQKDRERANLQKHLQEMQEAKESNLIEVEALRHNVMHMESLIAQKDRERANLQKQLQEMQEAKQEGGNADFKALQDEMEDLIQTSKAMKQSYEKKNNYLRDANKVLAEDRDRLQNKVSVISQKDTEIDLLKDRIRKKEKTIEKLNNVVKEKLIEINELKFKKTDRGKEVSPLSKGLMQMEKRKSDRQSIYDENRSIDFQIERDVGTMTDPTSNLCQCNELRYQLGQLKNTISVLKYKVEAGEKNFENHPVHNDLQMMKLEVSKKELALSTAQQELRRGEAKYLQLWSSVRGGASKCHVGTQSDAQHLGFSNLDSGMVLRAQLDESQRNLKRLQEKYDNLHADYAMKEDRLVEYETMLSKKENEADNGNQQGLKEENEMLKEKYYNVRRAFLKLRIQHEGR